MFNQILFKSNLLTACNDSLALLICLCHFILTLKLLFLESTNRIVCLVQSLLLGGNVLHLLLLGLVELVVLLRIAESLIILELLLDHSLHNSIMRELFLKFKQFFADLPLVVGGGKGLEAFISLLLASFLLLFGSLILGLFIFLFLLFLSNLLLTSLLASKNLGLLLFQEVVNHLSSLWITTFMGGHKINQIKLAVGLRDLNVVEFQSRFLLGLGFADVFTVEEETLHEFWCREEFENHSLDFAVILLAKLLLVAEENLPHNLRIIGLNFLICPSHNSKELMEEVVFCLVFRSHVRLPLGRSSLLLLLLQRRLSHGG